jgi:biotin/methionine sulfoxide reductase
MPETQSRVTSSHWGAFRVITENGRITAVEPFEGDINPSKIPSLLPAAVYHRSRIARPSIRRGWLENKHRAPKLRGSDEFIELPWDEALDITATELERVRNEHGNQSIFGGSYGWASAGRFHHALGQLHRFLNCTGGYVSSLASYSTAGAQAIMPHVLGMHFLKLTWGAQNSWPMIAENTQTLVMFGGINPKNSQVSMGGVTRHETGSWLSQFAESGMQLVNVSPQKTDAYPGSKWHAIVPGTDTAMMLGLAFTLETENLLDREFLERCTSGYPRFKAYLLGQNDGQAKTPEWAADLCQIDADAIRDLARSMAQGRTLITVAWSLQRAQHGEQPYWMATTLAAMLGQIGLPGGGIGFGYGAIGGVGVAVKRLGGLTLPQGVNPVSDFIPVARIADMLLNPGGEYEFNGQQRHYADIRLVYWCGGNPFHHHQDINRLNRAWQRPETIIVHEPWWTATAQRADIVLPATTPYEREDIARAQGDSFLFHMDSIIPPVGEAKNDYDIFTELAKRMDLEQAFTEGRDANQWLRHLYEQFRQETIADGVEVPEFDDLCAKNWIELPIAGANQVEVPFADFRNNPVTAPLGTPSGLIEIFSEKIDSFGYEDCPGHPSWLPPDEWLGANSAPAYPLHLVSPQPGDKLHSQMECAISDLPGERPAMVEINCEDASRRGIRDGELVRVYNARGACRARARVGDDIRAGVVALPTGAWYDPTQDGTDSQGNPNVLTRDKGTSRLGQGSSAHTALVEIELWVE